MEWKLRRKVNRSICACLAGIIISLSVFCCFSFPSYALDTVYSVSSMSFQSRNVYIESLLPVTLDVDSRYAVAVSDSEVVLDIVTQVPIYSSFPDGLSSSLYQDAIRFYGRCNSSYTWVPGVNSKDSPQISILSNDLIFNSYSCPIESDAPISAYFYKGEVADKDVGFSFYIRTKVYVRFAPDTLIATNSQGFGNFYIKYAFNTVYLRFMQSSDSEFQEGILSSINTQGNAIRNGIDNQGNAIQGAVNNQGNAIQDAINSQSNALQDKIAQETQKQTDSLENGYNNNGMESSNDDLDSALSDYDQKEDELTGQAGTLIDAITFTDSSPPGQVLAAITFTSSFLQSLFVNMGDWNFVVVVALSLVFGLMLVGWFRFRK